MTPCSDNSPPWFTGRWRDWHRGHGCDQDDGKPRTPEGKAEIDARTAQVAAGRENDLSDFELVRLEERYADPKPTKPCRVCGCTEWSLHATGGGTESWYCKAASDARPMDWDHFGNSEYKVPSGDEDVVRAVKALRGLRIIVPVSVVDACRVVANLHEQQDKLYDEIRKLEADNLRLARAPRAIRVAVDAALGEVARQAGDLGAVLKEARTDGIAAGLAVIDDRREAERRAHEPVVSSEPSPEHLRRRDERRGRLECGCNAPDCPYPGDQQEGTNREDH